MYAHGSNRLKNFVATIANQSIDIASAVASYLADHPVNVDNKVDKETGKGLSTNDLTSSLKSDYDRAYSHSQLPHAPADATIGADWNINLSNIPSTFAPSGHSHGYSDIIGLVSALSDKQATLVSGTNIKTVNNQSLVGSGNITISGEQGTTPTSWGKYF